MWMIQKWIFFDVGLSVDPLDPPSYPLDPPRGRSIGDPWYIAGNGNDQNFQGVFSKIFRPGGGVFYRKFRIWPEVAFLALLSHN